MPLATWLLVTTTLVAPAPPAAEQARPVPPPTSATTAIHTFAVGGSIVAGSNGATGGFQYWFGDRVGVDMSVGYYRLPNYYAANGSSGYTFQTAPSVMVMLTKPDSTRQVNIRPYVGGGINYVSSSQPVVQTGARATTTPSTSGTGMQAFGGVEMTFQDTPRLGLTFEAAYFHLPENFSGTGYIGGLNYLLGVHFYLR
jgi:outer membrane protein W